MSAVVWHDIECGGYRQDLGVWLSLAREHGGPVLDVGAGTGRVTLELARAGFDVVALDADAALLAELERRAEAVGGPGRVTTVCADARAFRLDTRFPLIVVPMQTVQLLGGTAGRMDFLRCAAAALDPGGTVAAAIAEAFEEFIVHDGETGPMPDMREQDGVVYCSRPIAVRRDGGRFVLERLRETVDRSGARMVAEDRIALDVVTARELEREADAAGLRAGGVREIAPTDEHIGSLVVVLGG